MKALLRKLNLKVIALLGIIGLGAFLRFYNLNWGSPYFFHPDERNIASAVTQLNFPRQMNPHFFAYGSFPLYLIYIFGVLGNLIAQRQDVWQVSFGQAVMVGRLLSALLSALLIPLTFLVTEAISKEGRKGLGNRDGPGWGLGAAVLTAFAPGLIQYAHFGTFEIILTFEYLLIFYFLLKIVQFGRWRDYLVCSCIIGLSLATKVTSLILLPLLFAAYLLSIKLSIKKLSIKSSFSINFSIKSSFCNFCKTAMRPHGSFTNFSPVSEFFGEMTRRIEQTIKEIMRPKFLVSLLLVCLVGLIFSPYIILDYPSFRASMKYESSVAMGSLPVFYTAGFLKSVPFLYQFFHVFPYILGWGLWAAAPAAFLGVLAKGLRGDRWEKKEIILFLFIVLYFAFHGVMYVKWVRYMVPLIPFVVVMTVVAFGELDERRRGGFLKFSMLLLMCLATIVSSAVFFSRYFSSDPRIRAAEWVGENFPSGVKVLSELWDLGILPFNDEIGAGNIALFNFYELDGSFGQCGRGAEWYRDPKPRVADLSRELVRADLIVLPSQRVCETRLRLPECFPIGSRFYSALFNGELGFGKIYESPKLAIPQSPKEKSQALKIFQSLALGNSGFFSRQLADLFRPEETYFVFDYPKVLIFAKERRLDMAEYQKLLLN